MAVVVRAVVPGGNDGGCGEPEDGEGFGDAFVDVDVALDGLGDGAVAKDGDDIGVDFLEFADRV